VFSADARYYPFFEVDASAIFVGNVAGALVATFHMAIVNKLFLSPLRMHKDWGERNGIFASKPKSVASSVNPTVISISLGEKRGSFSVADELLKWAKLKEDGHITEEQYNKSLHLFTRQYAQRRLLGGIDWSGCSSICGTHTMRRTKATLIYQRTKNLRAVQIFLRHTKLESTVRYLGIAVDDALEIAEHTEV
jgi:hypothetical protein